MPHAAEYHSKHSLLAAGAILQVCSLCIRTSQEGALQPKVGFLQEAQSLACAAKVITHTAEGGLGPLLVHRQNQYASLHRQRLACC